MNTSNIRLGADPELFVVDANGALRSIIGLIGGTKDYPRPLPLGDGFAVQEDNVAMEFNIPPSESKSKFVSNIHEAREFLATVVHDQYGLLLSNASAGTFDPVELEHPMAQVFGCDPDYNAWTGEVNPKPSSPDERLRSAGGHVHVGCKFDSKEQMLNAVRGMDLMLGVPSVLMDQQGDRRRELYGKPGAYREKPYGFEYRVLSNFWVLKDTLVEWVWDATADVLAAVQSGVDFKQFQEQITTCIDKNDKEMAAALVREHNLKVVYA